MSPQVTPLECSGDDAQALGWPPLPALRQVLAACAFPELLGSAILGEPWRERARSILSEMDSQNIGGYNHEHRSHGVPARVAKFLEFRDGVPSDPKNIVLCSGTRSMIPFVLSLLSGPAGSVPAGVLLPVPGPPQAAAAAGLAGAVPVPFPLHEARGWAVAVGALSRALRGARGHCRPEALWLINPGDPTGHVMSREEMESIIRLADEESLLLLADEVHQERTFSPERPFLSFRRVLAELGPPLATRVQLISFYSLSQSVAAESGFRAGFLELLNVDPEVLRPFQLAQSIPRPCVPGRILLDLLMAPPDPQDPISLEVEKHRRELRGALAHNARRLQRELGRAPGIRCPPLAGGPRAFPRIRIPARARSQARALGLEPDVFFCRELQEATGLEVAPGSHFGLGTAGDSGHLGLSLLLPAPELERALRLLRHFHQQFLREFS